MGCNSVSCVDQPRFHHQNCTGHWIWPLYGDWNRAQRLDLSCISEALIRGVWSMLPWKWRRGSRRMCFYWPKH